MPVVISREREIVGINRKKLFSICFFAQKCLCATIYPRPFFTKIIRKAIVNILLSLTNN